MADPDSGRSNFYFTLQRKTRGGCISVGIEVLWGGVLGRLKRWGVPHRLTVLTYARYGHHGCAAAHGGHARAGHVRVAGFYPTRHGHALRGRIGWFFTFVGEVMTR